VISQSPLAGTQVSGGSAVDIVVSQGPVPISVPNVVGMTQAAAQTAVTAAGLTVGTVTTAYHSTVPAGSVISQSPIAGTQVSSGSAVDLMISSGIKYSGGSGMAEDPYKIASAADLIALGDSLEDYNKNFILTTDIDLSGHVFTDAVIAKDTGSDWGFQGTSFTGVFNGNGKIISNLTIAAVAEQIYVGLFGCLSSEGQVKKLGLINVNISGGQIVGGMCGDNDSGEISQCYISGIVRGYSVVGGICGTNGTAGGEIMQSYTAVSVIGGTGSTIGGLCGDNQTEGIITQCYSTGEVTGSNLIGGLCGNNLGSITTSFWNTETSGQSTSSGGTGKTTVEMKKQSNFTSAEWDFVQVWGIVQDQTYPYLKTGLTADLNNDGVVDLADFNIFASNWLIE
jgi:hypothetical protein